MLPTPCSSGHSRWTNPLADDADGGNAQALVTCMDYNAADARGYGYRLPTTELPTAD